LLAELYFAAGMNKQALLEFESSLKSMPNRYRIIAGAAASARAAGMVDVAKRYYGALTVLAAAGEARRPELAEAKSFLSQH
jgi:Tfp pilus assembly protein PilF